MPASPPSPLRHQISLLMSCCPKICNNLCRGKFQWISISTSFARQTVSSVLLYHTTLNRLYRHFPNPPSPLLSPPQDTTNSPSTPRPSRSGFASERPLPIRSSLPRATCNSHRCSRLLQCWPLHPHPRRPPNLPCLPTVRPRIVTCGTPTTTNIILWPVLPPPHTITIFHLSYGSWRGMNWTRIISHC